jgi:hypothetical protein
LQTLSKRDQIKEPLTFLLSSAARLNVPRSVCDLAKTQHFLNLIWRQGINQILLIRKHKYRDASQLIFFEQFLEFFTGLVHTHAIRAVHDED